MKIKGVKVSVINHMVNTLLKVFASFLKLHFTAMLQSHLVLNLLLIC